MMCPVFMAHFSDKIHDRSKLRREGSRPSGWGVTTAEVWVAGHLTSGVRKQRKVDAETPLMVSFSSRLEPQPRGIPGRVKPLETPSQRCIFMVILNPVHSEK